MKAPLTALLAVLVTGCSFVAEPKAHPRAILVIRHAEKPDNDDIHLSEAGKKRAEALPHLFKKSDARPDPFPAPDVVFAAKRSKHSDRSAETVTPLAKVLKVEVDTTFDDDDFARLAGELVTNEKYQGKTVLVCWHHGKIPELLHSLGVDPKPKKVGDGVFDRVWVVSFGDKGKAKLAVRPQTLLPLDGKE